MPGTPDPVLGSDLATAVVAILLASALVLGPVALRDRRPTRRLTLASGALAATVGLVAWAGPRLATGAFARITYPEPLVALAVYAAGLLVIGLQTAGPVYGYLIRGLVAPLAAGVAATALVLYALLQVGGESEALFIYTLLSPVALGAILAVALLEVGGRWAVAAVDGPD